MWLVPIVKGIHLFIGSGYAKGFYKIVHKNPQKRGRLLTFSKYSSIITEGP